MRKPAPSLGDLPKALTGIRFQRLLNARGITKWRLGKDTVISYRTLINWRRSRVMPSEAFARKAGAYLGLIGDKDQIIIDARKKIAEQQAMINRLES